MARGSAGTVRSPRMAPSYRSRARWPQSERWLQERGLRGSGLPAHSWRDRWQTIDPRIHQRIDAPVSSLDAEEITRATGVDQRDLLRRQPALRKTLPSPGRHLQNRASDATGVCIRILQLCSDPAENEERASTSPGVARDRLKARHP